MTPLRITEGSGRGPQTRLTPANERALRRFFEEVCSEGKLHLVEELIESEFSSYCAGTRETYLGPSGVINYVIRLRSAFFGLVFDIEEIRETPWGIEAQWTARGRLERAIMGVQPVCLIGRVGNEPGGPEIEVPGRTIVTMTDGKVRASYIDWNLNELRNQVQPKGAPPEVR